VSRLSRRDFLRTSLAGGGAAWSAGPLPSVPVPAAPVATEPGELPRRVLALYKSYEIYNDVEGKRPKTATLNEVHGWAQMPLNWLGLMVEYHDVARGLPDDAAMGRYRGVVTWYQTDDMDDPLGYLAWLGRQMRAGRRVVILGALGALRDRRTLASPDLEQITRALAPSGLEFHGRWTVNQRVIELVFKDPAMMEFERRFPPGLPNYQHVVARRPDSRVHLVLRRRDIPRSESHMVVTGPWGGLALDDYVRFQAPAPYGTQWWINPFAFFEAALGVADWPRPDVTTLNGRRVFYSHIDGDGMRNLSEVRPGTPSGQIILEEVLARYPLPITVSVVAAEVDPGLLGTPATRDLARAMLALPNVEAASHSFTHPLDWVKRTRSFNLPQVPYSVETEVAGSIQHIEAHLLPPGKRVRTFQWSGSTRVTEEALAVLARLGVPNINGGDPMLDRQWPSYTRVAPLMRQVGAHWQNYTSASNENLYTNLWQGPYYGFRHVVETFRNTGSPRRVSPVNVYYHFYSGERVASLAALRYVYDWVLRQPLAPVFTSQYLASVEGFRTARIARVPGGWRVWDHGGLRTLRFDGGAAAVDMARSRGVLGWHREQDSLYVHLAGPGEAVVALAAPAPEGVYLASASHTVTEWRRAGEAAAFVLSGVGAKSVALGGLVPRRAVTVEVREPGGGARTLEARASAEGQVALDLGAAPRIEVRVR
jgi:hypothetical protein